MGINNYQQLCVRGMSSRKCIKPKEMDGFQIFFENAEEEFYRTPAIPSDEMWKKFELILTPPRSPNRENEWNLDIDVDKELCSFSEGDFFDQEAVDNFIKELTADQGPSQNLSLNLIQDPMWPQVNTTSPSDSKLENGQILKRIRCDSCSRPTFDVHASECVDPAAVFPYPIGGTIAETKIHSLGIDTPSDSEEEIDVVTVEKKQMQTVAAPVKRKSSSDSEKEPQQHVQKLLGPVKLTIESKPAQKSLIRHRVDASTEDHFYSLPHSYSLKRSLRSSCPSSPESDSPRPVKRQKLVDFKNVVQRLKSCRNSSDSDECETGKRTQHNVLERKRRTDLKLSFFSLRDSVPELQGQERAPKVLILKKAADYIHSLNSESKRFDREIESLKAKQEQLKRTMVALRGY